MTITATSSPQLVTTIPSSSVISAVNANEDDASTAVEVIAAPGAGKAIYLLEAILTCADDDAFPVLQDEDANLLFGPFYAKAAGPLFVHKKWEQPRILKIATNKALQIKAAAGGNVSIYIEYAVGPAS